MTSGSTALAALAARTARPARWRDPLRVFPLLVLAAFAVLVVLDLNGSSIGILSANTRHDPSLVYGKPRIVRSDEAQLSTPTLIGNVRRDFPTTPWVGLTPTFLPATSIGAPSYSWTEAFKPQDWGLFTLGLSRGFAWHWWSEMAIGVLGMFALLFTVTRRSGTSAALASVGALSPYVAWWSLIPGLVLGFGCGAAAMTLAALRTRRTGTAVALGAGAGYLATAAFLVLYPPWLVALAWVLLLLIVGAIIDSRVPALRVLVVGASTGVVIAVSGGFWYVQSKTALLATEATLYPGHRLAHAGQGNVAWLFDQPSSVWAAAAPPRALRGPTLAADGHVLIANQSEIASTWLPLPLLVVVVIAVIVTLRRRSRADTPDPAATADPAHSTGTADTAEVALPPLLWSTVGVALAGLLLLAWSLLPLPDWVGKVTALDLVPSVRTPLGLGAVTILLLAIGSTSLREVRWSGRWKLLWVAGIAGTVWLSFWATRALPWDNKGETPSALRLLALAGVLALAFALVASGRALGVTLTALVVVCTFTWVVVNPVYRGLGPFVNDPLVKAMEPLAPARVAVYGPQSLDALVAGSGVVVVSGVTLYPDAAVWRTLAPDQEVFWNNYSKYAWVADASVNPARIEPLNGTQRTLRINPCAPQTLALHIDWVVSSTPLSFSCLTPVDEIKRGATSVFRYRVVTS